jgi:predicted secreted protein
MAVPTEIGFALIKIGDGQESETFATVCGIQDVSINQTSNTRDEATRDCTKPGETPTRKVKAVSKQWDISGTGMTNADQISTLMDAIGAVGNFKVEVYADDGTDAGDLIGTYAGAFMMTANNLNLTRDGQATAEISLASHGAVTYTAAT